jgi:gamma-glutamylcyclotransferase (GGCT)/AIG2-like uncharacterized protein YtfP
MGEQIHRIFVYGSLKRGYRLHRSMVKHGCQYAEDAELHGYTLYAWTRNGKIDGIAYMAPKKGGVVKGEILLVPESTIVRMDGIERMYERTPVTLADGTAAEAYVARRIYEQPDIGSVWDMSELKVDAHALSDDDSDDSDDSDEDEDEDDEDDEDEDEDDLDWADEDDELDDDEDEVAVDQEYPDDGNPLAEQVD